MICVRDSNTYLNYCFNWARLKNPLTPCATELSLVTTFPFFFENCHDLSCTGRPDAAEISTRHRELTCFGDIRPFCGTHRGDQHSLGGRERV